MTWCEKSKNDSIKIAKEQRRMKALRAFTGVLRIFDNKKVDRDIVDNHTNKLRKSLATSQHSIRARKDV